MVLQKNNEASEISQWVFYRAARINAADNSASSLPDLNIAVAFDQTGRIAKAIVTPILAQPDCAQADSLTATADKV